MALVDLTPDEVAKLTIHDRIALLKSNVIHFCEGLLLFELAEIWLIDEGARSLKLLLTIGIDADTAIRDLCVDMSGSGAIGFVAATGKSHLCEDTSNDSLHRERLRGAKSTLTVPLILHDRVIGAFNVESTEPRAFGEGDRQFLESFGRDVSAIDTLGLQRQRES